MSVNGMEMTVGNEKVDKSDIMKDTTIDMVNRDPTHMNDHIKVSTEMGPDWHIVLSINVCWHSTGNVVVIGPFRQFKMALP